MKTMIGFAVGIILLPVTLILRILSATIILVMRVTAVITGPFLLLLGVLGIFTTSHQEYRNTLILMATAATIVLLYFCSGFLAGLLEDISKRLLFKNS